MKYSASVVLYKTLFTLLFMGSIYSSMFSQTVEGQWGGVLNIQGTELRLVFNIQQENGAYSATMDSPDQHVSGIPVTETELIDDEIKLAIPNAGILFKGNVFPDSIVGIFSQAGFDIPLKLTRQITKKNHRPQDPKKPLPYQSEEVEFANKKSNLTLAGTLTLPEGDSPHPAVILISGSGPQNRDSEIFNHRPFWVIADHLSRNGIAVLRYDDRGVGESQGDFSTSTSRDFAEDVSQAIEFLKTRQDIDEKRIGLIGHSEGGMIAPMVAAEKPELHFIVLLAAPGLKGDELMLLQKERIEQKMGIDQKDINSGQSLMAGAYKMIIDNTYPDSILSKRLFDYFSEVYSDALTSSQIKSIVEQVANPWFRTFIKHDPEAYLPNVTCPILALNGEKDLQVPPKENLQRIEEILLRAGHENFTLVEFPALNHLFQECETGLPNEYGQINQTISPEVLTYITQWISDLSK